MGVEQAVALATATCGGRATGHQVLSGSNRTVVVRVDLTEAEVTSVVVKLHLDADDRDTLVREPAGLSVLPSGSPAVVLRGVSTSPAGVVLDDLGPGTDLAALLLGDDPVAARDGVLAWARALGGFLHGTLSTGPAFERALDEHATRLSRPRPAADAMPAALVRAAEALPDLLAPLGVTPTSRALEALRGVTDHVGDVVALTPADTCPDNNHWDGTHLVLLDFEAAQLRSVAWDGAYLRTPWPSCWCSWRLPDDVAADGLALWRAAVGVPVSDEALDAATLGWSLLSASWFLERALAGAEQAPDEVGVTPTRRAMVQHRLRTAPGVRGLEDLTDLAHEAARATFEAWGEVPLERARAFR